MPNPSRSSSRSPTRLEISDLDCSICSRLLYDPITLSCGHTLCRSCLKQSLHVKRQCPFCRHPCTLNPLSHPPSTLLVSLLEKYFPQESATRSSEQLQERRENQRRLPLFYTRSVEFPNRNVHYVIHQTRYQRMVADCLASKREFVAVADGKDVGCLMTIVDARGDLNGHRLILCRGLQPVRITDLQEVEMGFGLMSAAITPIVDEPQSWEDTADMLAECRAQIIGLLEASPLTLARNYEMDNAVAPEGPSDFSYWAFGLVRCPESLKFAALAEANVGKRLQYLLEAISESRRHNERHSWSQTLVVGAIVAFAIAMSLKEHLSSK